MRWENTIEIVAFGIIDKIQKNEKLDNFFLYSISKEFRL